MIASTLPSNADAFEVVDKCKDGRLRPRLYGEKLSGQEGHPPSRVNFSERLYEKNVDPFARVRLAFQ